jgi:DNA-binding CsgD family transcriptional regulator
LTLRHVPDGRYPLLLLDERRTLFQTWDLRRFGLTPRESEVLGWVAQGKTNAEAAALLGTRPRTIHKHLDRVFRKLGVENRTAAAAFVLTLSGG